MSPTAVLGIETSCDETAAAIVVDGKLVADRTTRQILHEQYGGVVPELASRSHQQLLGPAVEGVLSDAGLTVSELAAVAATSGPGLAGALLVGVSFAKGLSLSANLPLLGINHLEAHLWSAELALGELPLPFLALIASGGHTLLVEVKGFGAYRRLGSTRDDAAGELFDKVGRMMGIAFPAGAVLDREALEFDGEPIWFPRARLRDNPLDFSFSGLKTAVLYYLRERYPRLGTAYEIPAEVRPAISAGVMTAVGEMLVARATIALEDGNYEALVVTGGVASSSFLRNGFQTMSNRMGIPLFIPPPGFCTDNGAMVAYAGYRRLSLNDRSPLTLAVDPAARL